MPKYCTWSDSLLSYEDWKDESIGCVVEWSRRARDAHLGADGSRYEKESDVSVVVADSGWRRMMLLMMIDRHGNKSATRR
jgi:hypothetical protein